VSLVGPEVVALLALVNGNASFEIQTVGAVDALESKPLYEGLLAAWKDILDVPSPRATAKSILGVRGFTQRFPHSDLESVCDALLARRASVRQLDAEKTSEV
jgi:hypothetical protein